LKVDPPNGGAARFPGRIGHNYLKLVLTRFEACAEP